jgi:hypothetical protein
MLHRLLQSVESLLERIETGKQVRLALAVVQVGYRPTDDTADYHADCFSHGLTD